MANTTRRYQTAAMLLFLSAALHVPVLILEFSTLGTTMIAAIIAWALLGFALMRGMRSAAYLAFVGMLIGLIVSLGSALTTFGLVSILFWLIFAVDLLAALVLFRILWASRPAPDAA